MLTPKLTRQGHSRMHASQESPAKQCMIQAWIISRFSYLRYEMNSCIFEANEG